jgi:hypothetical protein
MKRDGLFLIQSEVLHERLDWCIELTVPSCVSDEEPQDPELVLGRSSHGEHHQARYRVTPRKIIDTPSTHYQYFLCSFLYYLRSLTRQL